MIATKKDADHTATSDEVDHVGGSSDFVAMCPEQCVSCKLHVCPCKLWDTYLLLLHVVMGGLRQATGTSCEATQYWRSTSNVARLQFVIRTCATCSRLERHEVV